MPIYQYDCGSCAKRVDVFFRSASRVEERPKCPECGARRLTRVMSQFARTRTATDRLSGVDFDLEQARLNDRDPGSFAHWARRVGGELDEDLGTNYRELAERAEAGEFVHERLDAAYTLQHRVESKLASGGGEEGGGDGHDHGDHAGHDHAH
jgi:putative FmdB family regulatory protein